MSSSKTILVTGATGTLGRRVVQHLLDRGHAVRALVRGGKTTSMPGVDVRFGDLRSGEGLAEATRGVSAIVHAATAFEPDNATDIEGTKQLVAAARASGSPHLVYISIIGIDRSPFFYFQGKRQIEDIVAGSGLPHSILRTSQFHDFVLRFLTDRGAAEAASITLPSGLSFQPIDADEVAAALGELAVGPAQGRVPDMGGPEALTIEALAEAYRATVRPELKITIAPSPEASDFEDAFREGRSLSPTRAVGKKTWATFLRERRAA